MKFKELPEGHYFVHRITNTVYVERLEAPETYPRYITELETIEIVRGGRGYRKNGHLLDDMEIEFKTHDDMRKQRRSQGASYGHVTRRLNKGERLTGKTLDRVLDLIGEGTQVEGLSNIAKKLEAGQPLDEYERHIMVDMVLPHARLGG